MSEASGDGTGPGRPRRRRAPRPEPTPAQRALGLLVRREHSRQELSRKLCAKGVAREEARLAVDRLTQAGWQSDSRFAENLVRSRAAQGQGPLRIRAELATHGLDGEAIRQAFAGFEDSWDRLAFDLVQRRFGAGVAADRALQRKAGEFLLRRGFDLDQMRRATRSSAFDDCFDG